MRKTIVFFIALLLIVCTVCCTKKTEIEPLECEFIYEENVGKPFLYFMREMALLAKVTGGSGSYKYYFDVYEGKSIAPSLSSSDENNPLFMFSVNQNKAFRIVLTVIDSDGQEGRFEYNIEKAEQYE